MKQKASLTFGLKSPILTKSKAVTRVLTLFILIAYTIHILIQEVWKCPFCIYKGLPVKISIK